MQTFTLFHRAILPPWTDQLKGNLSGAGIEASKRIVPVVRDTMQRIALLCIDGKLTSMFGKVAMDTRMQWVQQLAERQTRVCPVLARKFSGEVSVMPNIAAWATAPKYL